MGHETLTDGGIVSQKFSDLQISPNAADKVSYTATKPQANILDTNYKFLSLAYL